MWRLLYFALTEALEILAWHVSAERCPWPAHRRIEGSAQGSTEEGEEGEEQQKDGKRSTPSKMSIYGSECCGVLSSCLCKSRQLLLWVFLLWQSVGGSSYDFIAFRSRSKHVGSMLISTFCPITHFFLTHSILKMECFLGCICIITKQTAKFFRGNLCGWPERCWPQTVFPFFHSASPPPDACCSLHIFAVLWKTASEEATLFTAHQMANSTSKCLLLPAIL